MYGVRTLALGTRRLVGLSGRGQLSHAQPSTGSWHARSEACVGCGADAYVEDVERRASVDTC